MSKYLDKARDLRASAGRHYNCAKGVVCSFAEDLGVSEDVAYRFAADFGGGMKMGSVCGAVIGCLMTLGMADIKDVSVLHDIYRRVKDNHEGCLNCADLLRINADKGGEKKTHCDNMVFELTEITEEILKKEGKLG